MMTFLNVVLPLRRLPSTVPYSTSSASWRQTWPYHNSLWHLIVGSTRSWRGTSVPLNFDKLIIVIANCGQLSAIPVELCLWLSVEVEDPWVCHARCWQPFEKPHFQQQTLSRYQHFPSKRCPRWPQPKRSAIPFHFTSLWCNPTVVIHSRLFSFCHLVLSGRVRVFSVMLKVCGSHDSRLV